MLCFIVASATIGPYSGFYIVLPQLGMKFDVVRSESTILHVIPFNSEKKRGGVAVKQVINKFYDPSTH